MILKTGAVSLLLIFSLISCQKNVPSSPPSSPPTSSSHDSTITPSIVPPIIYKKKLPTVIKKQLDTGAAYYYNYYYDLQNRLIAIKLNGTDSLFIHYDVAGKIDYIFSYNPTVITNKNFYYYSGSTITDSSWRLVNNSYQLQNGNYYILNANNQLATLNIPNALQMQYQYDTSGNIIKIDYKKPSCAGGICYSSTFFYDTHPSIYSCINLPNWFLLGGYESGLFILAETSNNITSSSGAYSGTYSITYDADGYPISIIDNSTSTTYTISYTNAN